MKTLLATIILAGLLSCQSSKPGFRSVSVDDSSILSPTPPSYASTYAQPRSLTRDTYPTPSTSMSYNPTSFRKLSLLYHANAP